MQSSDAGLVERLEQHFLQYAVLGPGLALVLALWVLAAHLFDVFDAFPYLGITSPTKRCGKTRLAELLELVCPKPRRTVNMSPPSLYRVIEKEQPRPTLLIDEAESLSQRDERSGAMREVLNAGYRRGQKVTRCRPNTFEVEEFETYCPKVLVLIGNLPDTLADRCIPIPMRRRPRHKPLARFRRDRALAETTPLREGLPEWAGKNKDAVALYYAGHDVDFLDDREAELWLPLLAVCSVAAPHRLADLEHIARQVSAAKAQDEPGDLGVRLLDDIRHLFEESGKDRLTTRELLGKLNRLEEAPWRGLDRSGITARGLANYLRAFEISSQTIRLGPDATAKGYLKPSFEDAWERYLPPSSRNTVTTRTDAGDRDSFLPVTGMGCDPIETATEASVYAARDGVTDTQAGSGSSTTLYRPMRGQVTDAAASRIQATCDDTHDLVPDGRQQAASSSGDKVSSNFPRARFPHAE
jgi:hypothetical protein